MSLPTQPQPQPEKVTAAELRGALQLMTERLDQIESSIAALCAGLASAAAAQPQPGTTAQGDIIALDVDTCIMSYDDAGQPVYKVKGGQYSKFGIRVWPEVLPALGLNPASLKPGPNALSLRVQVLMGDNGPRKVIGLAK